VGGLALPLPMFTAFNVYGGNLMQFAASEFRDLPSHASNYLWLSVYAKIVIWFSCQHMHVYELKSQIMSICFDNSLF
jgi:hypothetical protein